MLLKNYATIHRYSFESKIKMFEILKIVRKRLDKEFLDLASRQTSFREKKCPTHVLDVLLCTEQTMYHTLTSEADISIKVSHKFVLLQIVQVFFTVNRRAFCPQM